MLRMSLLATLAFSLCQRAHSAAQAITSMPRKRRVRRSTCVARRR